MEDQELQAERQRRKQLEQDLQAASVMLRDMQQQMQAQKEAEQQRAEDEARERQEFAKAMRQFREEQGRFRLEQQQAAAARQRAESLQDLEGQRTDELTPHRVEVTHVLQQQRLEEAACQEVEAARVQQQQRADKVALQGVESARVLQQKSVQEVAGQQFIEAAGAVVIQRVAEAALVQFREEARLQELQPLQQHSLKRAGFLRAQEERARLVRAEEKCAELMRNQKRCIMKGRMQFTEEHFRVMLMNMRQASLQALQQENGRNLKRRSHPKRPRAGGGHKNQQAQQSPAATEPELRLGATDSSGGATSPAGRSHGAASSSVCCR